MAAATMDTMGTADTEDVEADTDGCIGWAAVVVVLLVVTAATLTPTALSAASSRAHNTNEGHLPWVFDETAKLELERVDSGMGLASLTPVTPRKRGAGSSTIRITTAGGKEESLEWLASSPIRGAGSPMPPDATRSPAASSTSLPPASPDDDGDSDDDGDDSPHATSEWSGVDLSHMTLRHLAPSLGTYSRIVELDISHNLLQSVSPHVFAGLHHLKVLNLSHNLLSNVQDGWVALTSLRVLNLAHNHIQYAPFDLGSLYALKSLNLTANPVSNVAQELLAKTDNSIVKYLRDVAPPPPAPPLRKLVTSPSVPPPTAAEPASFTVFCYNVLCDAYATEQMYPHTPTWALDWEFRKSLILNEILNMQADIICLQELQMKEFDNWLQHELLAYGYKGVFKAKSRVRTMHPEKAVLVDGCATFYRTATFTLEAEDDVEFSAMAMAEPSLRASEDAFNRLLTRDNIALILTLRSNADGHVVVVSNTHVHFDPKYADVKVIQVQMLLEATASKVEALTEATGTKPYAVVCGDFNSLPESGVYKLLKTGFLKASHEDMLGYSYGSLSKTGIKHRLSLNSAYASILNEELPFTNYTPLFKGVIDYIWVDSELVTEAVLEGLTNEEARKGIALPNAHHPSDHIPLACKIRIE
ncbi:CCR4-Not complex subunit Ccr4 [Thecamonas trahens ATCC 50062]|uniref:poly(A)-specific ribonuclease n=1 Tax=Thecamonas trahens ATCC 50062 TaxID=461836 RepID=A0A0L0DD94_THETB|nr:CCR4-Not complex subunit Ccr4 [Thecamonas trahens ATCC 50062]KNC50185.1 CCR4-Not complex subunit Ccr4 [Thecamonas trahens ATCC 50062]|eukprot:XP_013757022.1 CCR4-Not complex subunit Ccr4 [Thecamonas trahens ATCC 50062]